MNRRQFIKSCSARALALAGARVAAAQIAPAATLPIAATPRKAPYILGADVSWLLEDEAQGATYWDRGVKTDLLEILKSYGINAIRARIFVNPGAPGGYAARRNEAFCDLEHTKKFATRIKAAGLGFLLSIHYGDTWTSPGKQAKPVAWAALPFPELVKTVHDWTAGVLKGLGDNKTPPDMVSVGNETSDGVLFPDGAASNFDNFAKLINAGCMAVREFNARTPIALHNHLGRDNNAVRMWVDNFLQRKTEFDIIGMSCYNQARPGDWQRNFNDLATRYEHLSFLALEYSYYKRQVNDLIYAAPNNKGLGSFIWEPTRWREAIFDVNGQNAGNDDNNRPHLPASTLPAADAANQPVYKLATPPSYSTTRPAIASNPVGATATATRAGTTSAPASRPRFGNGGKYETNSFILAYPEMAKAYAAK